MHNKAFCLLYSRQTLRAQRDPTSAILLFPLGIRVRTRVGFKLKETIQLKMQIFCIWSICIGSDAEQFGCILQFLFIPLGAGQFVDTLMRV